SVLRVKLPYHPVLWLPLVALHVTLAVRVAGSLAQAPFYRVGAVGTIVAMLLLVLGVVSSSRLPVRGPATRGPTGTRLRPPEYRPRPASPPPAASRALPRR